MKSKGFTLIEMMIVFAILSIAALFAFGLTNQNTSNVSWGVNGTVETRCISGYQFVVGHRGQARQIVDEMGKGVRCD